MYLNDCNYESIIHTTTHLKVKHGSILIGYYKSHGVGIRVSVIGKLYGLL